MTSEYSRRAKRNYDAIVSHINKRFGSKAARKYEEAIDKALDLLEANPKSGVLKEPTRRIRALTVNKLTQIFYVAEPTRVFVLDIFDVRKDPRKQPT